MEYCDGQNLSNIINEYTEKNELIQEEIILTLILIINFSKKLPKF